MKVITDTTTYNITINGNVAIWHAIGNRDEIFYCIITNDYKLFINDRRTIVFNAVGIGIIDGITRACIDIASVQSPPLPPDALLLETGDFHITNDGYLYLLD